MKHILKLIPAFALVMAVTVAFATSLHSSTVASKKQAFINGTWVDITGQQAGVDYRCKKETQKCTRMVDENLQVVPGSLIKGTYQSLQP